ncbi:SRPBCC domain-containing protein [Solirubrobacter phytolaccae]|uniref:SRPBCC domain-containing protein n=1 Tax=Solirubrobacter phytolaccae TaxID=1404360 RepID=A0A9X3S9U1_9ACTN|nr:SRPBCC domain-containing protein [Solirubrobacter phytolaccae]MDA0179600.1 SRPBCC domain-containing protein [Solirubrobacter phytolaccae]
MRRENRIEVPGTPEQVWEAIATGHGIETWFVPAEVEGRVGGKVRLDMGTGMADSGVVTDWDPPRRFAYEETWEGEVEGKLATEFLVEAQSGGTTVIRLVSTVQATGGNWDDMLDNLSAGWDGYLLILKTYLEHFAGQPCRTVMVARFDPVDRADAYAALTPPWEGEVVHDGEHERIVRMTAPAPGIGLVMAFAMGGATMSAVHLYLYGADAPDLADEWRAWLDSQRIGSPSETSAPS